MFGKKKEDTVTVWINDSEYETSIELYHAIFDLKEEISRRNEEVRRLTAELENIKPVIEAGKLTPAVSNNCYCCRFCVRSRYDGSILVCNRESVCEHFDPNKKE